MAAPSPANLVEVKSLGAGYPGREIVIQDISFTLQRGQIFGIIGANGTGKSTLLKSLCGLIKPSSGQILINGRPIQDFTPRELSREVSSVLQTPPEEISYSVREYVSQGRYPHLGPLARMGHQDHKAVDKALSECSLLDFQDRIVSELSAGEYQRTILAQALAQESEILLLDEPNAHLDLQHHENLVKILQDKAEKENKAIIIILHDIQVAKDICDQVLLLHEGCIHGAGDPLKVLSSANLEEAYPPIKDTTQLDRPPRFRYRGILSFLPAVLLIFVCLISLQTGEMGIPTAGEIFSAIGIKLGGLERSDLSPLQTIFWELRLPRTLLGVLVGANIAVAGALMQGYFRNPLAEPYIAGVSAGAACSAVFVLTTSLPTLLSIPIALALPLFAFLGAVLSTWIVYKLSTRGGHTSTQKLLLGGIAIGGILQAITIGLLLRSEPHNMQNVLSWLMGSLAYRGWEHIPAVAIGGLVGLTISLMVSRPLDLLATRGDDALTLGLPVQVCRRIILATSCFLAATSVASCGIIAFVGLMAPHIVRMIYGARHINLIPQTAILGALLLTLSDILARTILPSQELPIGIITGVIGALFLLFLIARKNTKKVYS